MEARRNGNPYNVDERGAYPTQSNEVCSRRFWWD